MNATSLMAGFTPVLFITANVGSIFENPETMLGIWIQQFLRSVTESKAKFVALHCQEVGGKNYEVRMQHVQKFIQLLVTSNELQKFDKMEVFIDEDFSHAENFTALGSFYFIHEDISEVEIWNFEKLQLFPVKGKNIYAGNIEDVPIKEKSKFPQTFFPECKWSRKGYLRTRWNLNGTIFDLVNIHLFHDASNFIAMQTFPSAYTLMRQKSLNYTLNQFYNYEDGAAPFFLFGDFNFRTDTQSVIKKLVSGLSECRDDVNGNGDSKLQYKDDTSEVIFTLDKKEFNHSDHQKIFINDAGKWLKEFDRELDPFVDQLYEFPISFAPSYPFEENYEIANEYMKTRCPAWCDRVLLSINAKHLIKENNDESETEYGVIGVDTCMGDHKPVFLRFNLINKAGMALLPDLSVKNFNFACKPSLCNPVVLKHAFSLHGSNNLCNGESGYVTKGTLRQWSRSMDQINVTVSKCTAVESANVVEKTVSILGHEATDITDTDENIRILNNDNQKDDTINFDITNIIFKKKYNPLDKSVCSVNCTDDSCSNIDKVFAEIHHHSPILARDKYSCSNKCSSVGCNNSALNNSQTFNKDGAHIQENVVEDDVSIERNDVTQFDNVWRNKIYSCDTCWRSRSVSMSERLTNWYLGSRVRLKSDPELKLSLPRIESHHSSSDEEWFEEVEDTLVDASLKKKMDDILMGSRKEEDDIGCDQETASSHFVKQSVSPDEEEENDRNSTCQRKTCMFCFCFPKSKRCSLGKSFFNKNKTSFKRSNYKYYDRRKTKCQTKYACVLS